MISRWCGATDKIGFPGHPSDEAQLIHTAPDQGADEQNGVGHPPNLTAEALAAGVWVSWDAPTLNAVVGHRSPRRPWLGRDHHFGEIATEPGGELRKGPELR